jgi:hypothetical protein
MGEGWVSILASLPWTMLAVAFLCGIVTGWLFWGGRTREETSRAEGAAAAPSGPAPGEKLAALDQEIREARAQIVKAEEEAADYAGQLAALAETVKRVNGRLKLILRAVKKGSED